MKTFICLVVIIFFYVLLGNVSALVIPEEALRIRVIPHSNEEEDVVIKNMVKESLQYDIYNLLKDIDKLDDASLVIEDNLDYITKKIDDLFTLKNYNYSYNINFGLNYFPSKEYKGVLYEEGYYESLVITIGDGKGDNWWCVLFPPLCLVEENSNLEYTTYVAELIEKYS